MKTFFLLFCLISTALLSAADLPTLVNAEVSKDKRSLTFHFGEGAERVDKVVKLPAECVDVKRAPFMNGGVAFLVETRSGEASSFYYGTLFHSTDDGEFHLGEIKAPPGKWKIVGIANTESDTVVATAVEVMSTSKLIKGWIMADFCAIPQVVGTRTAQAFETPLQTPAAK